MRKPGSSHANDLSLLLRAILDEVAKERDLLMQRWRAPRIELTNGTALIIPIKLIPSLKRASAKELSEVEVLGAGGGLHWESLDTDLSVPNLASSLFDGSTWMAALGRRGGRVSSAVKAKAARKNGRKGGRPRIRATAVT